MRRERGWGWVRGGSWSIESGQQFLSENKELVFISYEQMWHSEIKTTTTTTNKQTKAGKMFVVLVLARTHQ